MKKERIDELLVGRGFAETIRHARAIVMAGSVLVDELRIEKPSERFQPDSNIRIKSGGDAAGFVGRGGVKLERALQEFHICPRGYVCIDVGASTGGFTDCLLSHGAEMVVAVDAGTNQLAWKLRNDPRVQVREKTNARNLKPADFDRPFDLAVVDVSFISLKKILPILPGLLKLGGEIVCLIKPQFEVRKHEAGDGGIVRESEKHERVVKEINEHARQLGLSVVGTIDSPITGAEGNKEFLAYYAKRAG